LNLEKKLLKLALLDRSEAYGEIGLKAIERLDLNKGELRYPTQYFIGYKKLLESIRTIKASCKAKAWLTCPEEIAEIFDKAALYRKYDQLKIPQPETRTKVERFEEVYDFVRSHQSSGVYLKHRFGSTGSGMLCLRLVQDKLYCWSTFAANRGKWTHLLNPAISRNVADIKKLSDYVIGEGAILQAAIKKAQIGGVPFDCRFIVINNKVPFVVVRKNRSPFTNLNLGGQRDTMKALQSVIPCWLIQEAIECCIEIARYHKQFMIGVDIIFDRRKENFYVLESNAFGGFFPNLSRCGRSVLKWELDAIHDCFAGQSKLEDAL